MTEQRDDLTHPPPPASPAARQKQSVSLVAHLASVLVAVALVPIAYLLLDYAMADTVKRAFAFGDQSALPPKVWILVGAASGLFVYPTAGALLIGSGLGGRWMRSR